MQKCSESTYKWNNNHPEGSIMRVQDPQTSYTYYMCNVLEKITLIEDKKAHKINSDNGDKSKRKKERQKNKLLLNKIINYC